MRTLFHPDLENLFKIIGISMLHSNLDLNEILEADDGDIRESVSEVETSIANYFQPPTGVINISEHSAQVGSLWALLQNDGRNQYAISIKLVRKICAELIAEKPHPKFIEAQLSDTSFDGLLLMHLGNMFHAYVMLGKRKDT